MNAYMRPYDISGMIMTYLCAVVVFVAFAMGRSDQAAQALVLCALIACLAAGVWLVNIKEEPAFLQRKPVFAVMVAFGIFALVLLITPTRVYLASLTASTSYTILESSNLIIEYIKMAGVICAFAVGFGLSRNNKSAKALMDALLCVVTLWAIASIGLYIMDPDHIYGIKKLTGTGRLSGAFSSPNSAGTLFAAGCLMCLIRLAFDIAVQTHKPLWSRLGFLNMAGAVSCFVALILTLSRGAELCFLISLVILLIFLAFKNRLPLGIIIGVSAGSLVCAAILLFPLMSHIAERFGSFGEDFNTRFTLFSAHFQAAMVHKKFGMGLGSFNTANNDLLTPDNYLTLSVVRAAHNVYLQWFEETGVVGLFALGLLNVSILKPVVQAVRRIDAPADLWAGLGCYFLFLLHGTMDYAFQEPALAIFVAIVLGHTLALATNTPSESAVVRSHKRKRRRSRSRAGATA
jgi:O-antigen ligase